MNYLARRFGWYVLAAFGAITVNFFIPRLAPGDPASAMFSQYQGTLSPSAIKSLRSAYGLSNKPLLSQYFEYLDNLVHGNLGVSLSAFPTPVSTLIKSYLGWSILLGGTAVTVSFVIGSAIGAVAAWRRQGSVDKVAPPTLMFVGSFPYFFLALLLVYVLAFKVRLFPLGRAYAEGLTPAFNAEFVGSVIGHLVLPAATIVLVSLGSWTLNMRNVMIGILSEDYLALAEAKGVSPFRVFVRHAVRNALLPNITILGMALGGVVGGQLLTEIVFSYPGVGSLLLHAITSLDYPLMQGLFLIIVLGVLLANFVVDSLYTLLDPRVRIEASA